MESGLEKLLIEPSARVKEIGGVRQFLPAKKEKKKKRKAEKKGCHRGDGRRKRGREDR